MKAFSKILAIFICMSFLFSTTSCVVFRPKDQGKHKGWYKNRHNPHNPNTNNPGKSSKKGKIKKY
jgi:hypothetical protein